MTVGKKIDWSATTRKVGNEIGVTFRSDYAMLKFLYAVLDNILHTAIVIGTTEFSTAMKLQSLGICPITPANKKSADAIEKIGRENISQLTLMDISKKVGCVSPWVRYVLEDLGWEAKDPNKREKIPPEIILAIRSRRMTYREALNNYGIPQKITKEIRSGTYEEK